MLLDSLWYGRAYLNASYFPRDFRDEMGRYADVEGSECPFVSSGYFHPSYSVLGPDALAYYLWWRTNARRGRVLKADMGHVWLFMTELVNAGDPASNLDTMIDVISKLPSSLMSRELASLPMGYALSHGLPPEAVPREAPFLPSFHLFLRDVTRYPMRMPDARILRGCADERWLSRLDDDAYDSVAEVVGLSLAGIDELVRSTQSCGLLRHLGCRTIASDEGRIRGFGDWSGTPVAEPPELDPCDPSMLALMEGVTRTAARFMAAPGARAPSPPKTFPREYAEVVAAAVDAVTLGDPWDPRSFRKGDRGFWEDDDVMLSPAVRMPLIVDPGWQFHESPRLSMKDIKAHWSENPEPGARHVPSGAMMTSYSAMDREQLEFYLSWRSGARRGVYTDVDEGYLWLYCSELLAQASDHVEAQRELDRAIRAYRRSIDRWPFESECLLVASAGHALLHGLEPEPVAVSQIQSSIAAYLALASEPTWRIDPAMAEVFAPDARVRVQDPDGLYEGAFTAAVRAVDEALKRVEGRRLVDLGKGGRSATVAVYAGLWSKLKTSKVIVYRDVLGSPELLEIMEGTLKTALRTVNRRTGRSAPGVPKGFPRDLRDAAESAVSALLDGLEEEARRERGRREAESIVLDPAAVDTAAADLEAVTGMMAAGREEEEPEEAPAEVPEAEDPWEALASSLDGTERAFILASLEGDGPSALRGAGRRPGEVESSINAKAMDLMGDALMEDGSVFEEYEAEIRRALG